MDYKYGQNINYEDFSSGRVLYQGKGVTNFPIRLAWEIFGRCLEYTTKNKDLILYDCCCGGGYLLTVLGFLNQDTIGTIIGSDINGSAVEVAKKNLSLLTAEGLDRRIDEIDSMINQFHKQSHEDAKESAIRLKEYLTNDKLKTYVFAADALKKIDMMEKPDIILVDVPYGELVSWEGTEENPVNVLLNRLIDICHNETIIGISMDKRQKVTNDYFQRLEKNLIGKRKFEILKQVDNK